MKIRILSAVLSAVLAAACALAPLSLGAQPQKRGEVPSASLPQSFLAGYDAGLYRIEGGGERAVPLWLDAEVRKIIRSSAGWYFLSSLGVVYSSDLGVFEDRSAGLPAKTTSAWRTGEKASPPRPRTSRTWKWTRRTPFSSRPAQRTPYS